MFIFRCLNLCRNCAQTCEGCRASNYMQPAGESQQNSSADHQVYLVTQCPDLYTHVFWISADYAVSDYYPQLHRMDMKVETWRVQSALLHCPLFCTYCSCLVLSRAAAASRALPQSSQQSMNACTWYLEAVFVKDIHVVHVQQREDID